MSRQYLVAHTVDEAHITDIFGIAATPKAVLSVSGAADIKVHSTTVPDFPLAQSIPRAHKLGAHHICASADGKTVASVGFGGEIKTWTVASEETGDEWKLAHTLTPKSGDAWAIALSHDGRYVAATTFDGCINVWNLSAPQPDAKAPITDSKISKDEKKQKTEHGNKANTNSKSIIPSSEQPQNTAKNNVIVPLPAANSKESQKDGEDLDALDENDGQWPPIIRIYHTAGQGAGVIGLCVDLSTDGKFTASGHKDGRVYVFDNDAARLKYCLSGLAKPVRAVVFSPGCIRLAAAGDSGIIAIYDTKHGQQITSLATQNGWIMSLAWNYSGEFLLSGSFDGKVKVWAVERSECVSMHSDSDKALWAVQWLARTTMSKAEYFVTGGASRSLVFYREASGG